MIQALFYILLYGVRISVITHKPLAHVTSINYQQLKISMYLGQVDLTLIILILTSINLRNLTKKRFVLH